MIGLLSYNVLFLFVDFIWAFLKFVPVNNMLDKPCICNGNISEIGGRKA